MGHRNDDKYSTLGGPPGQTDDLEDAFHGGPQDNDGWYAHFGGDEAYNDDAYDWLIAQGVSPGALPDMWAEYWAGATPPPSGPAFYALTPDPTTKQLLGVRTGTGGLTTTHTATVYAPDQDGIYQSYGANKPVWVGGRYVDEDNVFADVTPGGADIDPQPYLQYYPAAQNDCPYSNDLTNVAWVASGTDPVATFDQAGLTGAPNTASRVGSSTTQSGASLHWRRNISSFAGSETAASLICWIDKTTSAPSFPAIQLNYTGPSFKQLNINSDTGDAVARSGFAPTDFEVIDDGDFWKVIIYQDGITGTASRVIYHHPAICNAASWPYSGSGESTSGFAVFANTQYHADKSIAEVRGLGPIFTQAAPVATDVTIYTFDAANWGDGLEGALYCENEYPINSDTSGGLGYLNNQIVSNSSPTYVGFYHPNNSQIRMANTAGGLTTTIGSPYLADVMWRGAAVWSATDNGMQVNYEGAYSTQVNFDGCIPTLIRVGGIVDRGYSGKIREIQRFDTTSLSEGKTIIDGLMA